MFQKKKQNVTESREKKILFFNFRSKSHNERITWIQFVGNRNYN